MQTRFALGDKSNPFPAYRRIGHKLSDYSSLAHLALLQAFPTIRVSEDELYVVLDLVPATPSKGWITFE